MKYIYITLRNTFLFFFISALFARVLLSGNNEFVDILIGGLLFGIVMALMPNILQFMKIKESAWSLILLGIVITFIFFFVGHYVFDFFTISAGDVVLSSKTKLFSVSDQTFGLILISMISSISSVILYILGKQK
ncbi:MAG: hypothetical protein Q9M91_04920 [Candidatus Dojkabacteria bacterium]|nr:hypothetical protein [Candidatus Dojkabacteria bacterium]MDQ7021151.1 hypothetical protein [Candidatus Dojkabacteria bacterium]